MSKKVQVGFFIDGPTLASLKAHRPSTGESENALITRLLRAFLDSPDADRPVTYDPEDYPTRYHKLCLLDASLRDELRRHRAVTGEAASALIRRLLVDHFGSQAQPEGEGTVKLSFFVDKPMLEMLDARSDATGEDVGTLVVRLLDSFFESSGADITPACNTAYLSYQYRVFCDVPESLYERLLRHHVATGETASALIRRLLMAHFESLDARRPDPS